MSDIIGLQSGILTMRVEGVEEKIIRDQFTFRSQRVNGKRNKAAIIRQGEPDEDVRVYTYQMLHEEVCRFANVLN